MNILTRLMSRVPPSSETNPLNVLLRRTRIPRYRRNSLWSEDLSNPLVVLVISPVFCYPSCLNYKSCVTHSKPESSVPLHVRPKTWCQQAWLNQSKAINVCSTSTLFKMYSLPGAASKMGTSLGRRISFWPVVRTGIWDPFTRGEKIPVSILTKSKKPGGRGEF